MWLNSGFKSLFTIMLTPQLAHKAGRLAGQSLWLSQWDHYVPRSAARAHNLLNCRPGERPHSAYGPIGNTHIHSCITMHTTHGHMDRDRHTLHLDIMVTKKKAGTQTHPLNFRVLWFSLKVHSHAGVPVRPRRSLHTRKKCWLDEK